MKITRDKMFFSKDLIHTLAYVGMFVAAIISVGACKSGIWVAAILAWIVAGIIIGLAIISDYKKAELLKNGTRIIGKVTATKRVHIKFHMSTQSIYDTTYTYDFYDAGTYLDCSVGCYFGVVGASEPIWWSATTQVTIPNL